MPGLSGLISYALLSLGGMVAVGVAIKLAITALRRIARNHERSVALLEELVRQQKRAHSGSGTEAPDTTGRSATKPYAAAGAGQWEAARQPRSSERIVNPRQ